MVVHALGVNIEVLHERKFELPEGVDDDNVGEAVIPSISSLYHITLIFLGWFTTVLQPEENRQSDGKEGDCVWMGDDLQHQTLLFLQSFFFD